MFIYSPAGLSLVKFRPAEISSVIDTWLVSLSLSLSLS
jgi:hypothetical protein